MIDEGIFSTAVNGIASPRIRKKQLLEASSFLRTHEHSPISCLSCTSSLTALKARPPPSPSEGRRPRGERD